MTSKLMKYQTRTDSAIKNALLDLLKSKPLSDVTIAELARKAHVSRSTFYEHYGNPADVYDALVKEIAQEMSPLMSQIACSDGFRPSGNPFCELVRDAGPLTPVVHDARFADSLLLRDAFQDEHDLYGLLTDAGYTDAQARAVCAFQMSGCFNAARQSHATDEEWAQIRATIDRFILGGIAACLAVKRNRS